MEQLQKGKEIKAEYGERREKGIEEEKKNDGIKKSGEKETTTVTKQTNRKRVFFSNKG